MTSQQVDKCIELGTEYSVDKIPVSLYTLKSVGIDPGFSSSATGIVVLEHIKQDNMKDKIRVVESHLIEKGEVKPPDYDQFIQCYECGNIFPVYEAHFESEIKDSLETTNNSFEGNESVFLSTDNRASQQRKRERRDRYRKGVHKYTSKRFQVEEQENPEIIK